MSKSNSVRILVNNDMESHNKETREIKKTDNYFGNFLVEKGLYESIDISEENVYELVDLIGGHVKIDVYCPKCGERRVFKCKEIPYYHYNEHDEIIEKLSIEDEVNSWLHIQKELLTKPLDSTKESWSWRNRIIEDNTRLLVFEFVCSMDEAHHLDFIVLSIGNQFQKIGQYPSFADLSLCEVNEYRKVISRVDEKELKRAIGLFASGIGIGSFVYLRRIFERIIATASENAINDGIIEREKYEKSRVDEKIKMLKDYLPELLVENKVFYGIISKGIHELSEENCLEYFPVLKSFIMMILNKWEKVRKDAEEEKNITASISKIATCEK